MGNPSEYSPVKASPPLLESESELSIEPAASIRKRVTNTVIKIVIKPAEVPNNHKNKRRFARRLTYCLIKLSFWFSIIFLHQTILIDVCSD